MIDFSLDKVFHVHIPKTGGTTLNDRMRNNSNFINGGHSFYNANFPVLGSRIEDRSWKNFYQKGYTNDMTIIVIIRNPFDWLRSYYNHSGKGFFGFLNHSGWQGCNDYHKFCSFDDFIQGYLSPSLNWHVPPLKTSQIGQLQGLENASECVVVFNEYLDNFIDLIEAETGHRSGLVHSRNIGSYRKVSNSEVYRSKDVDQIMEKYEYFFELSGYNLDGFRVRPTSPYIKLSKENLLDLSTKGYY